MNEVLTRNRRAISAKRALAVIHRRGDWLAKVARIRTHGSKLLIFFAPLYILLLWNYFRVQPVGKPCHHVPIS